MTSMTDEERDAFMIEPRLGNLGIARPGRGPLLAPIWYRFTPGGTVDMCIGATSAKAKRLRAEGRATLSVVDAGERGVYRYVAVEGAVTMTPLGDRTEAEILAMSSRYLGQKGGRRYTDNFMARLVEDDLHDGHGDTEVMVRITPDLWRTEVLG